MPSEDWDFYFLLVDDEPASIYLDLALARSAPVRALPHMAYVRLHMRQPRPDGLSSNDEFETLSALEDRLTDSVVRDVGAVYAGRNTSGGCRDFYFYVGQPERFEPSVARAMTDYPDYRYEADTREDPDWDVYFGFLYPPPDDFQRIQNRRVIESLASHGDRHDVPRTIDHRVYLGDGDAAQRLRAELLALGFEVEAPKTMENDVALDFQRRDRPDSIDDVVLPIVRRARELGGTYDGWGCEVVS